jgi:hypothetical protein
VGNRIKPSTPHSNDGNVTATSFPFGAESPPEQPADPVTPPQGTAPGTAAAAANVIDPFDPATYKTAQPLTAAAGVEEILTEITARAPDKEWWCRVHPDPAMSFCTWIIELKTLQKENYLVLPALWPHLMGEPCFKRKAFYLAVTMQGLPFLWSVRQPSDDTKEPDRWMITGMEAIRLGKTSWVRMHWDEGHKKHRLQTSKSTAEPRWPSATFKQLIELAFKDYVISDLNHPILRQLRGEA